MKQLDEILDAALTWELSDMTLSNRKNAGEIQKIKVRPVVIKDQLVFQAAQYTKTQVFHKNIEESRVKAWNEWLTRLITGRDGRSQRTGAGRC